MEIQQDPDLTLKSSKLHNFKESLFFEEKTINHYSLTYLMGILTNLALLNSNFSLEFQTNFSFGLF